MANWDRLHHAGFGASANAARVHAESMSAAARNPTHPSLALPAHRAAREAHMEAAAAHIGEGKSGNKHIKAAEEHRQESLRLRTAGQAGQFGPLQTGAKGGQYYLSSTGQKVYVVPGAK